MKETTAYIRATLQEFYPPEEVACFIRLILSRVCGWSYNRQIMNFDAQLSANEKNEINAIVDRLKNGEPLQYILGETEFYSLPLEVNPSVLIPRHETEELTDIIIKRHRTDALPLNILDVGTGSGCIAVALAKNLAGSALTAVDISEQALATAKRNAQRNNVDIRFIKADILQTDEAAQLISGKYHIIVSNPPYVVESEKTTIEQNVLDYEPHNALFVPDDDPLRFYRAIADFARAKLTLGGACYFEINHLYADATKALVEERGFTHVEIRRDLSGKNRFVSAKI